MGPVRFPLLLRSSGVVHGRSSAYPIAVSPAQANVANVLNNVGATRPARDAVDARLVAEYYAGTGNVGGDNEWPALAAGTPPADTDHDGMPDQWETSKGLKPNYAADRNDRRRKRIYEP